MHVTFEPTEDPAGFEIVDAIEQRRLRFGTDESVSPVTTDTDGFRFPVDTACEVTTTRLQLDRLDGVCVRRPDGEFVEKLTSNGERTLDDSRYTLDISGPMKVYCNVPGPVRLHSGSDSLVMDFDRPATVCIGARSYHDKPATTIETSDQPRDLLTAIEALSSALKDTSSERAYPTLRGHPPIVERTGRLSIPDSVSRPDTDVEIVVPPKLEYLLPIAPLTFYYGAELVPGPTPRITTPSGEYKLPRDRFEDRVAEMLQQSLFLDCIVRTEGLYQLELEERSAVEEKLPFDPAALYGQPLHRQLDEYLSIPYDRLADEIPTWNLTAHLPAREESVTTLPYVVNDLGIVRGTAGSVETVTRETADQSVPVGANRAFVRSASETTRSTESEVQTETVVEPAVTDESIEHAWFGDHVPQGASKAHPKGFKHRIDREERSDTIGITMVCNDERMLNEQERLDSVYGHREDLPFSVQTHFGVTKDRFREILADDDIDFLHYIGHATSEGLRCMDGRLDVATVDPIEVDVFMLNACRSYEQGLAMIENGAIGGVGTIADVVNEDAIETGGTLARLLNLGFPLRAAMSLVRQHNEIGEQYLILGDGSVDVAQTEGGAPMVCTVDRTDDSAYALTVKSYPTREFNVGTVTAPYIDGMEKHALVPGTTEPIVMDRENLEEYLFWHTFPVEVGDDLRWNEPLSSVDIDEL